MALFAFVLSVRAINLPMITRFFGSDPSIFCFNVINVSTIICGLSVVALLVPVWIITVSRSSCNKSFRFCCMSSILPPGIGCTRMWRVFDNAVYHRISYNRHCFLFYLLVFCVSILAIIFIFVISCFC